MGLFDFLTGKGGSVTKLVAKANNKDSQSPDRFAALEQLRDEGSDEAIFGLLRRFSFVYSKSIEDEQEKEWVHDTLVEMGERVLPAIEKSLLSSDSISWQLKLLERVTDHDKAWPILDKVLAANDNEYARDPTKKVQLIHFLGESYLEPRASQALLQYLEDMDETVRFTAVEALFEQKQEEVAREALLARLIAKEEDSRRIQIRILEGFGDLGWNTHGHKGAVEELLVKIGRDYSIDGKGRIKKPHK